MSASCFFALGNLEVHANRATRANAIAKAWTKRSLRRLTRREGNLSLAVHEVDHQPVDHQDNWETSAQNWADSCGRTQIFVGDVLIASV